MGEEILQCPNCGQTNCFDITSCNGCEGEVYEMHCPECGCLFDPRDFTIVLKSDD